MLRHTFAALISLAVIAAADRPVDPTFLYRSLDSVHPAQSDLTTPTASYKPLFGAGDSQPEIVKGFARFGELSVEPGGSSSSVTYPREEQVYFVLSGSGNLRYGDSEYPIQAEDFMYIAAGVEHAALNPSADPLRIVVMGWHLPKDIEAVPPDRLPIANTAQAKKQVVGNHPPTTLYQLLLGATTSTRDILATGHVVTSLFTMEFTAGGTNHPHHHPNEEEVYLVLDGEGEMVAGGGIDGVEGRHPAKPGDAYFYRLNATVGFYAPERELPRKARILAVRSRYPGR